MTKKHFIALADLIRKNEDAFSAEAVRLLAAFCQSQNGQFRMGRWFAYIAGECGPSGGAVKKAKAA